MAITVNIPDDADRVTLHGLTQWDYGETLMVYGNLPSKVEVHFGYPGLREALVVSVNTSASSISVPIPDVCLEQAGDVTVWLYEVGSTYGRTLYTLTLPIIPRLRPAARHD